MIDFYFEDYLKPKYQKINEFNGCLARVVDQNGKCGFIDKNGKEVIQCQFLEAGKFSEGLAFVKDQNKKCGYINGEGKIVVLCQFNDAKDFSEGLAPIKGENEKWGYINKKGKVIIPCQFDQANSFSEGYATVSENKGSLVCEKFVDRCGNVFGPYSWVDNFQNGKALVGISDGKKITPCLIDSSFQIIKRIDNEEITWIGKYNDGMCQVRNRCGEMGYLDFYGNLKVPFRYPSCGPFNNGVALMHYGDISGFLLLDGTETAFYKNRYQYIRYLSEGLAPAEKYNKKFGYIDIFGKEIIPCRYQAVGNFREGMSFVLDENENIHLIDNKGNIKVTLPPSYYSDLFFGHRKLSITAESEEALLRVKIMALDFVKKELIEELENDVNKKQDEIQKEYQLKYHK